VVVVFFSISQSKLPGYILTAVIALGVLTARLFAVALENRDGQAARIVLRGTLALLVLSAAAGVSLGALILDGDRTSGHKLFELFLPTLPPLALSLGGVAVLAALARWVRDTRIAFAAFLSVPLLLVTVNIDLLVLYAQTRSSRDLAENIPAMPPDTEIACLKCLPSGLPFYLKRLVTVVSDDGGELTSNYVLFTLNSSRTWPERIVPLVQMDQWLARRDHPIFLLAKKKHLAQLRSVAANYGTPLVELDSNYWAALLPVPGRN
jgi:4-amino-4-deoxy-L-arabinose transferase-like glycosyltransferase